MNAIFSFILWAMSLFSSPVATDTDKVFDGRIQTGQQVIPGQINGVHIMNGNPRTVVALEDTHFRPM